ALSGPGVHDDVDLNVYMPPSIKTRRVETGGRSNDVQRQSALPGPKAIELPASEQPLSGAAGRPALSFSKRQLVRVARREDVTPIQIRQPLVEPQVPMLNPGASAA